MGPNGKVNTLVQTPLVPSCKIRLQIKPVIFNMDPKGLNKGPNFSKLSPNGESWVRFPTPEVPTCSFAADNEVPMCMLDAGNEVPTCSLTVACEVPVCMLDAGSDV